MTATSTEYRGRTALVTGSRRGVGRLIAEHFLERGAEVIGLARGEASFEHPGYQHFQVDIGDPDAVARGFRAIRKVTTDLGIVVNSAAVLTSQYAMIMPAGAARDMIDTNFLGTFLVSREAAKLMRKKKSGRIINISSMAVSLEPMGDSVYAACKAAITTLANVLAKEFAAQGVTCNTLAVSAYESDMLDQLPRDKVEEIVAGLPLPRMASAEDILNVIDFFASERSSYVTAQTIYLGGVH